jgi:4-carboxymuconolactone decarboxylase
MRSFTDRASAPSILVLVAILGVIPATLSGQRPSYPRDIDAESGSRLPLINRADLDEHGKKVFDENLAPGRTSLAGGPASLRMYVPPIAEHLHAANQYLRNSAGLPPRLIELAILTVSRELDAQFEWSSHEPAALRAGLDQQIIDVVKYRRSLNGLGDKEAAIVQLGREALGKKKVAPETFARAEKLFGKQGVVTIACLMGEYSAASVLLTIADQHLGADQKALLPIP